jgi:hypothetical protein
MKPKAQISLEFLLAFAALLSFILIFASLSLKLSDLSFFTIDAKNANSFLQFLETYASKEKSFSNETSISLKINVIGSWLLSCDGDVCKMSLNFKNYSKTFSKQIPITTNLSLGKGMHNLSLEKKANKIFLAET